MPVTARLSQLFYDRVGEQVANELVDWFNAVDATYRNDLRELNEVNFARFDAKVGERLAELRSQFREDMSLLEGRMSSRMSSFEVSLERVRTDVERVRTDIQNSSGSMIKWMFAFWAPTAFAVVGLLLRS